MRRRRRGKKAKGGRDLSGSRSTATSADRSRSPPRVRARRPAGQAVPAEEAALGRTASKASVASDAPLAAQRSSWREEIEQGKDNDDDAGSEDGFAPMEDDAEVARKLAESRKRREALMAKWVTGGEPEEKKEPMESLGTPDAPVCEDDGYGPLSESEGEATPKDPKGKAKQRANDMFEENADEAALKTRYTQSTTISQTGASSDDWDDREGYYQAQVGELMEGRYLVVDSMCGKGVFSHVVKAKDQEANVMVAIKIMRCNDMMREAAEKEIGFLERLNKEDNGNERYVIKLIRYFVHRDHLCLVFECMWDNFRVALKKYTSNRGMSLQAVQVYTKQLLIALRHIHQQQVVHADIKPDNILMSDGKNIAKICDLGSAIDLIKVEVTAYIVSRFYRAPEIVLGKEFGVAADVFAMGCTLFELFTGKILFQGRSNNDMVRLFMEVKGKFPHKMIKSGQFWKQHFDENLDFTYHDTNKVTRKKVTRLITDLSQKRPIVDMVMQRVAPEKQKSTEPEDQLYVKRVKSFGDLINQMTALDPEKRILASDALQHPFVAEPKKRNAQAAR